MTTELRFRRARGFRAILAALAVAAPACSPDSGTNPGDDPNGAAVSVVKLTPATAELGVGSTLQLKLTALDAADNELGNRGTVWASQDTSVAVVSGEGLVSARRVGVVQLQAVMEGKSAFAVVSVVGARVAGVSVTPATPSVAVGSAVQLVARVTDASGAPLVDRFVFWQSSNDAVARVSSTGLVSGVVAGTATITATSEGRSASAALTVTGSAPVTPPTGGVAAVDSVKVDPADTTMVRNTSARFTARVYSRGQTVTGRTVTWSATGAVTVTSAGEVTARNQPGEEGFVTATVEGKAGSARVRVTNKAVNKVTIAAGRSSLQVGEELGLDATVADEDGAAVTGSSSLTAWRSSAPNVLEVSSTGRTTARVKAVAAGSATITATAGEASTTTTFTVTAPAAPVVPPARVIVSTLPGPLAIGATQQLTATPVDAAGTALGGTRAVTWTSSAPAVASVSTTGAVTGVAAGSATITATIDGVSGTTAVQVSPPPPAPIASVLVAPATVTLTVGPATQALTATPRDAAGNALTGRPAAAWTSSNPAVATVGATTGVVAPVGAGTATITATIEGVGGTATVTVSAPAPAPVATVAVTPATASVAVGATQALAAATRDAAGNVLTGRAVSWQSSAPAAATVSATGVVTAVAPGTATITATSEGQSGTATITVPAPPPASVATVAVTPATPTVAVGATQQLTATPRDAAGTALTGRGPTTWASSNANVATVSAAGLVTAVGPGTATVTATIEGVVGSATATVPAPPAAPVATVAVTPPTVTVAVGATAQFTATTSDAAGNVLTGRAVVWASSNVNVATVTQAGVVTAVAAGTATIRATSEGVVGSAAVTVPAPPPAPVARVAISPTNRTIEVDDTLQFSAATFGAAGQPLTGRSCTFSVDPTPGAQSVATITPAGLARGVRAGAARIVATCEGQSDETTLTVEAD